MRSRKSFPALPPQNVALQRASDVTHLKVTNTIAGNKKEVAKKAKEASQKTLMLGPKQKECK